LVNHHGTVPFFVFSLSSISKLRSFNESRKFDVDSPFIKRFAITAIIPIVANIAVKVLSSLSWFSHSILY
jgi:hypothetical protein